MPQTGEHRSGARARGLEVLLVDRTSLDTSRRYGRREIPPCVRDGRLTKPPVGPERRHDLGACRSRAGSSITVPRRHGESRSNVLGPGRRGCTRRQHSFPLVRCDRSRCWAATGFRLHSGRGLDVSCVRGKRPRGGGSLDQAYGRPRRRRETAGLVTRAVASDDRLRDVDFSTRPSPSCGRLHWSATSRCERRRPVASHHRTYDRRSRGASRPGRPRGVRQGASRSAPQSDAFDT